MVKVPCETPVESALAFGSRVRGVGEAQLMFSQLVNNLSGSELLSLRVWVSPSLGSAHEQAHFLDSSCILLRKCM